MPTTVDTLLEDAGVIDEVEAVGVIPDVSLHEIIDIIRSTIPAGMIYHERVAAVVALGLALYVTVY